jgi:hypothetical protein
MIIDIMEEENVDEQKPPSNEFIDKITLEMLMNKNHYNRYISHTDPKKHQEHLDHVSKIKKYRNWILNTTTEFLDNPDNQVTTEVNDAFDFYVRTLMRHFEYKKMENEVTNKGQCGDEDILFGNMDNEEPEIESPIMKSFWGKHKVEKKGSSFGFPMNYIPRIQEKSEPEPIDYIA